MSGHEEGKRVTVIKDEGYYPIRVIQKDDENGDPIVILKVGGEVRYSGPGSPPCEPPDDDC